MGLRGKKMRENKTLMNYKGMYSILFSCLAIPFISTHPYYGKVVWGCRKSLQERFLSTLYSTLEYLLAVLVAVEFCVNVYN